MEKLGFGFMRLPLSDPKDLGSIVQSKTNEMVDYFIDHGFNYFDTAYMYHQGNSEISIKKALTNRYPRDVFFLTDKMPTYLIKSSDDYQRIFSEQLGKCGVDYFDCYLLHTLGEKNYINTLKYGGFEFMKKLKTDGRVKHIGFSYHDKAELLDEILTKHPEMEYVQLQINYVDWENDTIQSRKCYEVAKEHGKKIIVMEPVKGGSLAVVPKEADKLFKEYNKEASTSSWALRFAASLDAVVMVLSGMSTMEQIKDNVTNMRKFVPLNEEEKSIIAKVTDIINESIEIPCTSCQYCVDGCSENIPIPRYFALYNNQKQFGLMPPHNNYYINLTHNFGKASSCIECRQCEKICPQHIPIVEELKKVSKVFEK